MLNLAILIGVSKYTSTENDLPACKNDVIAMHQILSKTNKYEEILTIQENEKSAKTKELITNFILKHKENDRPVNELFFYFSGHGEFSSNEFYYILPDFDQRKKNQTSLQNKEMDDLIRTLKPDLVIKFIDACQSGTTYIKENNVVNKYFDDSKNGFKKCYFLNSSLSNQSSYQNSSISFFTHTFIKALQEHENTEIRYKDIIDIISDEFSENPNQTPLFVIQAELTEKFCVINHDLRRYLNEFEIVNLQKSEGNSSRQPTLLEKIKNDAKEYVDENTAVFTIAHLTEELGKMQLSGEIKELYNMSFDYIKDINSVPSYKAIGKWLEQKSGEYFAHVEQENHYDDFDGSFTSEITRIELKYDFERNGITINFERNYPNINSYKAYIVFILSKINIAVFTLVTNYIDESWESRHLNKSELQWFVNVAKISTLQEVDKLIEKVKSRVEDRIQKDIQQKFDQQDKISNENP